MALDLWTHQFCLACDKQVHSDGAAYCSESCRLADHEWTSTPSSQASSPGITPPCNSYPWSTLTASTPPSTRNSLHLSPPFDFGSHSRGQPTQSYPSRVGLYLGDSSASNLTPSSSHSSLCSMQSTASSVESKQLSDRSRQELKAYAISFEQVRTQRRRSY
ncbi:hypothetical protein G6O67_005924 [Ophiocordyceps sinensis]|uniref:Life-span regulatory factor n=2 Tax=Ophiocordyceps sinensis TaxID=72228 RepID=A0A8H4LY82_9HYPO|nr:hypothetical protein OCS_05981 [Ophiocordyceps sinensis CO18]KAF4507267.1 hypothetical protein G6O67_005924 [Ophiocordyceps sinensis]